MRNDVEELLRDLSGFLRRRFAQIEAERLEDEQHALHDDFWFRIRMGVCAAVIVCCLALLSTR